jgi:glycosyltransferase involved in cell wall biosynthesis
MASASRSEGRALYSATLGMVAGVADQFDAVHFHFTDWTMLPFVKALGGRSLVTFHMPIDLSDGVRRLLQEHRGVPLVSLSDAQRPTDESLNWQRTIYNGLPPDLYSLQRQPDDYCAFLGRLAPSKGPDKAIDLAIAANVPLKLAGPIQQPYFDEVIAPRLKAGQIEYVGEIDDAGKQSFLGNARALLFPTQVKEAFGLVMIEAMACGTPVVAFDRGAPKEIVTGGITGFVVSDAREGASRLDEASRLSREACRAEFDRRFSASRMSEEYCEVYARIASKS